MRYGRTSIRLAVIAPPGGDIGMEQRIKRSRFFGVALALVAMVFVACGGNGANTKNSDLDSPAPPDQQVLRLRLTGEPKTIDPQLANIVSETTLTKPLFAGLFTY